MKQALVVVALLVGCGDTTPYDVVQCAPSWDATKANYTTPVFSCERACEEQPANYSGSDNDMLCVTTTNPDYPDFSEVCNRTFDLGSGDRGCCLPEHISTDERRVRLWTCVK